MPEILSLEKKFSFASFSPDFDEEDDNDFSVIDSDSRRYADGEGVALDELEEADKRASAHEVDVGLETVFPMAANEVNALSETEQRRLNNLEQFNRLMTAQRKMIVALLQIPYALKTLQKLYSSVADDSLLLSRVIVRGETYTALKKKHGDIIPPQDIRLLCGDVGIACAALLDYQSVDSDRKQEHNFIDKPKEEIVDTMMGLYFKKTNWCKLIHAIDKSTLPTKYPKAYKELKEARAEIKDVESYFVRTNKGFLYSIALKMNSKNEPIGDKEDRFQAGADGLLMALEKWIPERGSFLTYAKSWIVRRIMHAEGDESSSIRIPTHTRTAYGRYMGLYARHERKHGVYPAPEEMGALMKAEGVDVSPETLDALAHMPKIIHVSKNEDDDSPREFACDKIPSPYAVYEAKEKRTILAEVMACLTPRESRIIALYHGLPDPLNPDAPVREYTLKEIGRMYGNITRERVRQIEKKAINKMKLRGRNAFPRYEP